MYMPLMGHHMMGVMIITTLTNIKAFVLVSIQRTTF